MSWITPSSINVRKPVHGDNIGATI